MSDSHFALAMRQICAEAEHRRLEEQQAEVRRQRWVRVRKATLAAVGVVLVGLAYLNRAEIGQRLQQLSQPEAPPAESELAKNLQAAREGAAKRDNALDDIQK